VVSVADRRPNTAERSAGSNAARSGRASIAVRLVVFAVVLAIATATAVGLLSYTRARRALEQEARARLALLADEAANDFHRGLEDGLADLSSWAHLEIMRAVRFRDVDRQLADFFRQVLRGRDVYRGVACFDATGALVAGAGEVPPPVGAVTLARPRIVAGAEVDGRLQIESPVGDPDHPGATIGTLVAVVEPRRLLRFAGMLQQGRSPHATLIVRTASGGHVIDTDPSPPPAGPSLESMAGVPGFAQADAPGFSVTVGEPVEVALAPVQALRMALLRTAGVAVLIASILGALVALWIGAPIRRLTRAVQRVSATGDLALPPGMQMRGEVGVLASAFDEMMATVGEQQAALLGQSRLVALGEIAASIAHEVRTPLSVLKTSAQLLGRSDLPSDEQRKLSGLLSGEVDRLNRVVTDLVDLARPRTTVHEPVSVRDAVERAVRFFAVTAERRRVVLDAEVDGDPLTIVGSRDQLHQVLLNLLHNALQATPDGGRVTVAAHRDGGWAVVRVEDTGPGFADAMLANVFTRFQTTKPDGTGLGLVISKRLVEEHRGRIQVDNVAGRGARVVIRLPCPQEER
jgi:signal transduction histidine kinase